MRIELLTPLVTTHPVEQSNFVDIINEVEPTTKDAPADDHFWHDAPDYDWMEGPDIEQG